MTNLLLKNKTELFKSLSLPLSLPLSLSLSLSLSSWAITRAQTQAGNSEMLRGYILSLVSIQSSLN